jgi:hypothetical protein
MASIAALQAAHNLLGHQWVKGGLERKLTVFLSRQSADGWFPEYGGADIGYLSVCLDMMCQYHKLSDDERVVEPIRKVVEFFKYFVHPDGTVGGEYASRNTTCYMPFGFEYAISLGIADAAAIKAKLYSPSDVCAMDAVDDRYFSHYLLHSFCRALEQEQINSTQGNGGSTLSYGHGLRSIKALPLPCDIAEKRYFLESGLVHYSTSSYTAIVGLQKGGTLILFDKDKPRFVDCGYRVSCGSKTAAATNWQDSGTQYNFDENKCATDGVMSKVTIKESTPILSMGLRVVAFMVGNKIIGWLKRKIILVNDHIDIAFKREIEFSENTVTVTDELRSPTVVRFDRADNMSLRYVASGKLYSATDLIAQRKTVGQYKAVKIRHVYNLNTDETKEIML